MRFTKMQGAGNDYVYVDCFDQTIADPAALAVRIADRHYGVGGDGLILVLPDDDADVRMRMFNADGSEAQMCGNGVRCVAKYAWDHQRTQNNPMRVATGAGVKTIHLRLGPNGRAVAATVDMGEPILPAGEIPTRLVGDKVLNAPIEVEGMQMRMTCVSMGNPHAVFYVDSIENVDLYRLGPAIETHEIFPEKTNVHFVQIRSRDEVDMITWERGSGETLACGTGACAVCVAGVMLAQTNRKLTANLPGGSLQLEWNEQDNHVYMTGPAVEVFSGEWPG